MQIYLEDYMSELTNIENGKVKLSLKIPAEDYRRALESAYRRTGAHYNIPGFRKGKVPRKVIRSEERRVGKECRSRWSPYH